MATEWENFEYIALASRNLGWFRPHSINTYLFGARELGPSRRGGLFKFCTGSSFRSRSSAHFQYHFLMIWNHASTSGSCMALNQIRELFLEPWEVLTTGQIVWWRYGRGHNFCLQKSRMPTGRIGIFRPVQTGLINSRQVSFSVPNKYWFQPDWFQPDRFQPDWFQPDRFQLTFTVLSQYVKGTGGYDSDRQMCP